MYDDARLLDDAARPRAGSDPTGRQEGRSIAASPPSSTIAGYSAAIVDTDTEIKARSD